MEKRLECLTDEMLMYLDALHSGKNLSMNSTIYYLAWQFPELSKMQSAAVLGFWLGAFAERHTKQENDNGS